MIKFSGPIFEADEADVKPATKNADLLFMAPWGTDEHVHAYDLYMALKYCTRNMVLIELRVRRGEEKD